MQRNRFAAGCKEQFVRWPPPRLDALDGIAGAAGAVREPAFRLDQRGGSEPVNTTCPDADIRYAVTVDHMDLRDRWAVIGGKLDDAGPARAVVVLDFDRDIEWSAGRDRRGR